MKACPPHFITLERGPRPLWKLRRHHAHRLEDGTSGVAGLLYKYGHWYPDDTAWAPVWLVCQGPKQSLLGLASVRGTGVRDTCPPQG